MFDLAIYLRIFSFSFLFLVSHMYRKLSWDNMYICHFPCGFTLIILLTHRWLHKHLITKESIFKSNLCKRILILITSTVHNILHKLSIQKRDPEVLGYFFQLHSLDLALLQHFLALSNFPFLVHFMKKIIN